ncbi:MAG: dTMP kinase [Syntrophothermus sp.]
MFITFEGIDFCGKSTQVELLTTYLVNKGKEVEIIREPGGTEISEKIRNILLDKKNSAMVMETEIFLFSAARAQLVREKIKTSLEKGIYVISDRFHDSTTAYQGFGRGIPLEYVNHINSLAIGNTIPDLTFFLDIEVEEAERRKSADSKVELDRIEMSEKEFYNKVRNGYLSLANTEKRFRIIDGKKSKEEIHYFIINELNKFEKE